MMIILLFVKMQNMMSVVLYVKRCKILCVLYSMLKDAKYDEYYIGMLKDAKY